MGDYSVVLKVADNHGLVQDNVVMASVCDCTGSELSCKRIGGAGIGLPVILGILGAVLLLLCKFVYKKYIIRHTFTPDFNCLFFNSSSELFCVKTIFEALKYEVCTYFHL